MGHSNYFLEPSFPMGLTPPATLPSRPCTPKTPYKALPDTSMAGLPPKPPATSTIMSPSHFHYPMAFYSSPPITPSGTNNIANNSNGRSRENARTNNSSRIPVLQKTPTKIMKSTPEKKTIIAPWRVQAIKERGMVMAADHNTNNSNYNNSHPSHINHLNFHSNDHVTKPYFNNVINTSWNSPYPDVFQQSSYYKTNGPPSSLDSHSNHSYSHEQTNSNNYNCSNSMISNINIINNNTSPSSNTHHVPNNNNVGDYRKNYINRNTSHVVNHKSMLPPPTNNIQAPRARLSSIQQRILADTTTTIILPNDEQDFLEAQLRADSPLLSTSFARLVLEKTNGKKLDLTLQAALWANRKQDFGLAELALTEALFNFDHEDEGPMPVAEVVDLMAAMRMLWAVRKKKEEVIKAMDAASLDDEGDSSSADMDMSDSD